MASRSVSAVRRLAALGTVFLCATIASCRDTVSGSTEPIRSSDVALAAELKAQWRVQNAGIERVGEISLGDARTSLADPLGIGDGAKRAAASTSWNVSASRGGRPSFKKKGDAVRKKAVGKRIAQLRTKGGQDAALFADVDSTRPRDVPPAHFTLFADGRVISSWYADYVKVRGHWVLSGISVSSGFDGNGRATRSIHVGAEEVKQLSAARSLKRAARDVVATVKRAVGPGVAFAASAARFICEDAAYEYELAAADALYAAWEAAAADVLCVEAGSAACAFAARLDWEALIKAAQAIQLFGALMQCYSWGGAQTLPPSGTYITCTWYSDERWVDDPWVDDNGAYYSGYWEPYQYQWCEERMT